MCGIVGYTGMHSAAPVLLDGLSKLEYRGYDSAGIAVRDGENRSEVIKAKGRLKSWWKKQTAATLYREPVASAIPDGQRTVSRLKITPTHI